MRGRERGDTKRSFFAGRGVYVHIYQGALRSYCVMVRVLGMRLSLGWLGL